MTGRPPMPRIDTGMDYRVTLPTTSSRLPVILSIPHCGTSFPGELRDQYVPELIASPDDTDWYVDRLYDFAPGMGIVVISAVWSRWVIDLNRDPSDRPLYSDGRIITGLCPVTTFRGEHLYLDKREQVSPSEIQRRKKIYYDPYHDKLTALLAEIKSEFGTALLWDCHSIRQLVPRIHSEKFPDLILGSADGTSAAARLIDIALSKLESPAYSLRHNYLFKGGYITRHYGAPERDHHVLQLEMTKVNYMDDDERRYDEQKAGRMSKLLQGTLSALCEALKFG